MGHVCPRSNAARRDAALPAMNRDIELRTRVSSCVSHTSPMHHLAAWGSPQLCFASAMSLALHLGFCTPLASAAQNESDAGFPDTPLTQQVSDLFRPPPAITQPSRAGERSDRRTGFGGVSTDSKIIPSTFNLSARGGVGLLFAVSPDTLKQGEWAFSATILNYDRNPGDVDLFEHTYQVAVGLPGRTELFVRASPTLRPNAVGLDPVGYPIPPLDLFVDVYPSLAVRSQPYFLFAQEVPYKSCPVEIVTVNPPGDGAFSSSSGDIVVGFKTNVLSENRHHRFGFAVRAFAELPTETPVYNTFYWYDVGGTSGRVDYGVDLLLSKRLGTSESLLNIGYKRVGDPDRGLSIQLVDSSRLRPGEFVVGDPLEFGLDLRDEVLLNVGTTFPAFAILNQQVWFIGEFGYKRYVGGGTTVERLVHPVEVRLGLELHFPWYRQVSLGMAWQLLLNDAGDGDLRTSQFVGPSGLGDINFSEHVDEDVSADIRGIFTKFGAQFSENSSKVLSTNNHVR